MICRREAAILKLRSSKSIQATTAERLLRVIIINIDFHERLVPQDNNSRNKQTSLESLSYNYNKTCTYSIENWSIV